MNGPYCHIGAWGGVRKEWTNQQHCDAIEARLDQGKKHYSPYSTTHTGNIQTHRANFCNAAEEDQRQSDLMYGVGEYAPDPVASVEDLTAFLPDPSGGGGGGGGRKGKADEGSLALPLAGLGLVTLLAGGAVWYFTQPKGAR
jgi:hypothetical protein